MLRFAVLLLALLSLTPARSATYRVSPSPPGPIVDGLAWATAFPTVQQALDAALTGDEVWVAAGTYKENLTLNSGVGLYGGFAGTEAVRTQRDPAKHQTTLDAQRKGPVVTIVPEATSNTVVDGFSIVNGAGVYLSSPYDGYAGGGIYIGYRGTPVISNNVISGCSAFKYSSDGWSGGGGIFSGWDAKPLIAGNTLLDNAAAQGGGIFAYGGLIRDNYFARNRVAASNAWTRGGGMVAEGPAVIVHNTFEANQGWMGFGGSGGAGGVWCENAIAMDNVFRDNIAMHGSAVQCYNTNTFVRNVLIDSDPSYHSSLAEFDGGVFSDNLLVTLHTNGLVLGMGRGNLDGTQPVIRNNTIVETAGHSDAGIITHYFWGEAPTISNNVITGWADAGWIAGGSGTNAYYFTDHNDIYDNTNNTLPFRGASQVGTNGNISADPLFVDAASGDYRLQAGSPCIDAGHDATVTSGDRDLLGAPRIAGSHVDIGAYENGSPAWTMLDAAEVLKVAAGLSLATPAEASRLDVVAEDGATGPNLTVLDATRIAGWLLN